MVANVAEKPFDGGEGSDGGDQPRDDELGPWFIEGAMAEGFQNFPSGSGEDGGDPDEEGELCGAGAAGAAEHCGHDG
mgnify:CR=1 FL=1